MGCRTRVMGNVYAPEREVTPGRGNLSFTSINLPRLAIRAKGDICLLYTSVAGPQCMVTPVADFTPARLVAVGAEGKGEALTEAALAVMAEFKPQHTLVEIAPCGLPLDPDSKASLVENRDQYARAAQFFDGRTFDAFFLNGFTTADDLKCALMGLRKVTDAPIIASVDVQGDGGLASGRGTWREAVEVMAEYGAAVAGFSTLATPDQARGLADAARETLEARGADLCLMATLQVFQRDAKQQGPTTENPYYSPDTMMPAALEPVSYTHLALGRPGARGRRTRS